MLTNRMRLATVVSAIALAAAACGGGETAAPAPAPAPAPVEEAPQRLLEGTQVTLVVPFGPGGGYDTDARLLADGLGEILGATIVPENRPGAGGLLALNQLVGAPADGSIISLMNGVGAAGAVIVGDDGVAFDLAELTVISRIGFSDRVITTGPRSGITAENLRDGRKVRFGATGPGDGAFIDAVIFGELLGLNYEIVTGFAGIGEVRAAMIAGDIDLMGSTIDSQGPSIASGDVLAVLLVGEAADEVNAPGAPSVLNIGLDAAATSIMQEYLNLLALGRLVVGPPGMDQALVEEIDAAFREVLARPALIETMTNAGRTVAYLDTVGSTALTRSLATSGSPEFAALLANAY